MNQSLNIWNAGPRFFLRQNFGSLPVKVTIVSQWKKLEFLNMTWKGHPVASSEICCSTAALKFSSHGFRLSLDFSLNPGQSGDGNICWLECRVSTDTMDDTLLPSWCFFLSTSHEATDVPAKGHLWVWAQGKDSYRSASELQRRNLIVSRLEPTKQSLLSVAHHKLWGHVALSLLLDPRTWQQGTTFALGGRGDRGRTDNFMSDTGISPPPAYGTNSIDIYRLSPQSLQTCAPHCSSANARKKLSFPSLCSSNASAYLSLHFHWKVLTDGKAGPKQHQSFGED